MLHSIETSSKCFFIFIFYFLNFWSITIKASRVSSPNWLLSFVAYNPIAENALSGSTDVGLIVRRALNNFCRFSGIFFGGFKEAHFFFDNGTFNFVLNFSSLVSLFHERSKLFRKSLWLILRWIIRNLHCHFILFCVSLMIYLCSRDVARAVIFVFRILIPKWSFWFSPTKSGLFK